DKKPPRFCKGLEKNSPAASQRLRVTAHFLLAGWAILLTRANTLVSASASMNTKRMSKSVLLILNGKAAENDALRAAVAWQRALRHRIDVRVTWERGDAQRFV